MKLVLKNFTFNSLIYAVNIGFPILVLPYYIRILGVHHFGTVAIAQSTVLLVASITDLGLNSIAIKKISSGEECERIFYSFKLLQTIAAIILLSLVTMFTSNMLFMLFSGIIIYEGVFPIWKFQAKNNMNIVFCTALFSKTFQLVSVIIYSSKIDTYTFATIHSISMLIPVIWIHILRKYRPMYSFNLPEINSILRSLSWVGPVKLIDRSWLPVQTLIISSFLPNNFVTINEIIQKISKVFVAVGNIVVNSTFPLWNRLSTRLKMVIFLSLISSFLIGLLFFYLFWPEIMAFFLNGITVSYFVGLPVMCASGILTICWFLGENLLLRKGELRLYLNTTLSRVVFLLISVLILSFMGSPEMHTIYYTFLFSISFELGYKIYAVWNLRRY